MSAASRRKGADGEREFCRIASDALGETFRRNLSQYQQSDGDVRIGPFLVEVKNCRDISEGAWWKQAVEQAERDGSIPALAIKRPRKGWRVTLPLCVEAVQAGDWRSDLGFTMTLRLEGFWLICRELWDVKTSARVP